VTSDRPVNLAFGSRISLLDLIAELESVLGHRVEVRHADPRPGDVRASQADDSLLRALFPEIRPVPLRQGLEETVAWFRAV
jgi:UDP-glucose 4-epimerase